MSAKALDAKILGFIAAHANRPSSDAEFGALALEVFAHQYETNAFYRTLCIEEGARPGRVHSWRDVPAMPAAGFKELVLASFPQKNAVKVFRTSGTTGETKGAHFFDTLKLYEAALVPPFRRHLLPDGADCEFFFLAASPAEAPHSSLSHMMDVLNRRFSTPRGKFYVSRDALLAEDLAADLGRAKKKALILATAFSLKAFLDFLAARKLRLKLPAGSRLMETGGFKGRAKAVTKAALYRETALRLGIPPSRCVSEYGMTELSSQFYDTTFYDAFRRVRRRPFKAGPAWTRTVVVDVATGKEAAKGRPGLLRHYDLANRGSVMAVETEDLGRAAGEGFELLGRAPGAASRGCSLAYESLVGRP